MTARVLVIGEALIDVIDGSAGRVELVGGSPANVAVGVARQRHDVGLLTRIGRDERGGRIAAHISASGAAIADGSWADIATSTALARLQPDGSAEYRFAIDWQIPVPSLEGVDLVHSGSIALFLDPGGQVAVAAMERAARGGALVTLDPNIRPALVGERTSAAARFRRAAAVADLVKLSDEDAAWLYPGWAPADVLAEIASYGPRIVVMTRGADGAIGHGAGGVVEVPSPRVDVADTIGAGDAYMAGLISSALDDVALFETRDALIDAMRRAAVTAAITVSRSGADPPTREEVDAWS